VAAAHVHADGARAAVPARARLGARVRAAAAGERPSAVQQYYVSHPWLAPLMNHLGLFNVFARPGSRPSTCCSLRRLSAASCAHLPARGRGTHAAAPRTAEPGATASLGVVHVHLPPDAAVDAAASILGGQRFRLRRPGDGDAGHWFPRKRATCGSRQPDLPPVAARRADLDRDRRALRLQGRQAARRGAPSQTRPPP